MSMLLSNDPLSEIIDDLTSITDVNLLKSQLIYQRKNLFSLSNLLIKTELSYNDLISNIDYKNLLNQYNQLKQEYHFLQDEYQYLGHACLYLINKTHDLIDERNKYYNQWENNQSLLTPRPDWDKVSNIIDGGIQRWKNLSLGKTSEELVDILIKEILGENYIEKEDFQAIGDDLEVLPFLRMTKYTRIINRQMRRRITGILIKEIWSDKIKNLHIQHIGIKEQTSPILYSNDNYQTLADYVANYFEKRFDSKLIAIEMGYNLCDACQRYHYSEQINLFWGIITGQIEELVYHHQMKSISQLFQHLIKMKTYFSYQNQTSSSSSISKARKAIVSESNSPLSIIVNHRLSSLSLFSMKENQESIGNHFNRFSVIRIEYLVLQNNFLLTNEEFIESLKIFYPYKTSSQINELFLSAKYDLQYSNLTIEFNLLFFEDDEGRFGKFLSTLIKQIYEEKLSYIEQIKQILLGYPLINISQFSRAIYMIDPNISQYELHRYIQWVFQIKNFHLSQQNKSLDLEDLLRRLENCACFKH